MKTWTAFGQSSLNKDTRIYIVGPETSAGAVAQAKRHRPDFTVSSLHAGRLDQPPQPAESSTAAPVAAALAAAAADAPPQKVRDEAPAAAAAQ